MAKNELMVKENFELAINGEVADIIAEELDGLGEIPFDRVKIPSGGGLAFEVPGDDPDSPDIAKELVGIVIDHHPVNAYWESKYDGQNTSPSCSSMDGKYGNGWDANWNSVNQSTGELIKNPTCNGCCRDCYFNKFGSDGEGKACKNMHRLYILPENSPLPYILTLPPTSIKAWKEYLGKRIVVKGLRPHHVITKVTLKKQENKGGISYSSAQFSIVGRVDDKFKAELDSFKDNLKKTTRRIGVIDDDYNTTSDSSNAPQQHPTDVVDDEGFVDVSDTAEPMFEEAPTSADE